MTEIAEAQGIRKSQISRISRVLPLAKSVDSDQALNAGDARAAAAGGLKEQALAWGVQDVVSRHPSYVAPGPLIIASCSTSWYRRDGGSITGGASCFLARGASASPFPQIGS